MGWPRSCPPRSGKRGWLGSVGSRGHQLEKEEAKTSGDGDRDGGVSPCRRRRSTEEEADLD